LVKYDGLNPLAASKTGDDDAISKQRSWGGGGNLCQYRQHLSFATPNVRECGVCANSRGLCGTGRLASIALWEVLAIKNFDQALKIVREMAETYPVTLVNSVNPGWKARKRL